MSAATKAGEGSRWPARDCKEAPPCCSLVGAGVLSSRVMQAVLLRVVQVELLLVVLVELLRVVQVELLLVVQVELLRVAHFVLGKEHW